MYKYKCIHVHKQAYGNVIHIRSKVAKKSDRVHTSVECAEEYFIRKIKLHAIMHFVRVI
jgi:hypothetical protein